MIILADHYVGADERHPRNENSIPRLAEVGRILPTNVLEPGGMEVLGVQLVAYGSDGDGEPFSLNISPILPHALAVEIMGELHEKVLENRGIIEASCLVRTFASEEVKLYHEERAVKRAGLGNGPDPKSLDWE